MQLASNPPDFTHGVYPSPQPKAPRALDGTFKSQTPSHFTAVGRAGVVVTVVADPSRWERGIIRGSGGRRTAHLSGRAVIVL